MPLNRMAPEAITFPEDWGNDAVPLIKWLKFPEPVKAAFQQVRLQLSCSPASSQKPYSAMVNTRFLKKGFWARRRCKPLIQWLALPESVKATFQQVSCQLVFSPACVQRARLGL